MNSQKRVMKILIIVILAVFLLSSALVSVMYFADMKSKIAEVNSGIVDTGIVNQTGSIANVIGDFLTGK